MRPGIPYHFVAPPSRCEYLPDQSSRLEYEVVPGLTPASYTRRLLEGWRRFGSVTFRPRCRACSACRSLRVDVARFRPDRSQRRAWKRNESDVTLLVGEPAVDAARLDLYRRFHAHQQAAKGWPGSGGDPDSYRLTFVDNPFPTREWRFELGGKLVGVGYVDELPVGLSAIYFFHDPDHRDRSLGTWNVLRLLDHARSLGLPHLYLGYHVAGCRSLAYKARFAPNQALDPNGTWRDFML
ncbi:MAG TPA: arginyltransferase [Isosphaeraceae bacterium]|jgi:arginine-tRNA-protein transferase|nr:arginyltransferase [Isosphaeraceae bacterium]